MNSPCPICHSATVPHDVIDLNASCDDRNGKVFPLAFVPIYYNLCPSCGHYFAPQMLSWSPSDFEREIYNDDYPLVDPDCMGQRAENNADALLGFFGANKLTHLDYGGGNGRLAELLRKAGMDSTSYDPFHGQDKPESSFDVITAFEVFEHVPDPHSMMDGLICLTHDDSMILFSTLLSDGEISPNGRLSWWYAAPRNGHISLFSSSSLKALGKAHGLSLMSFYDGMHGFYKNIPSWFPA